jgi:hypothetical protein
MFVAHNLRARRNDVRRKPNFSLQPSCQIRHSEGMKALIAVLAVLVWTISPARADVVLAGEGKPRCVVIQQPGATEAEKYAVKELVRHLNQITRGAFEVTEAGGKPPSRCIIVGPGPVAKAAFPKVPLDKLGGEELVIQITQ